MGTGLGLIPKFLRVGCCLEYLHTPDGKPATGRYLATLPAWTIKQAGGISAAMGIESTTIGASISKLGSKTKYTKNHYDKSKTGCVNPL